VIPSVLRLSSAALDGMPVRVHLLLRPYTHIPRRPYPYRALWPATGMMFALWSHGPSATAETGALGNPGSYRVPIPQRSQPSSRHLYPGERHNIAISQPVSAPSVPPEPATTQRSPRRPRRCKCMSTATNRNSHPPQLTSSRSGAMLRGRSAHRCYLDGCPFLAGRQLLAFTPDR